MSHNMQFAGPMCKPVSLSPMWMKNVFWARQEKEPVTVFFPMVQERGEVMVFFVPLRVTHFTCSLKWCDKNHSFYVNPVPTKVLHQLKSVKCQAIEAMSFKCKVAQAGMSANFLTREGRIFFLNWGHGWWDQWRNSNVMFWSSWGNW